MTIDSDDADRRSGLQNRVAELERELSLSRDLVRDATARTRSASSELEKARLELRILQERRSVKLAQALAVRARTVANVGRRAVRAARRLDRSIRRWIREQSKHRRRRASAAAETALVNTLRGSSAPAAIDGPRVSIVILNRDGRDHLERCLGALATTAYRNTEIIVVDNASTDGSPELAERFTGPFPIKVIRNQENRSFSEANGQGVAVATGTLLCFLNNDVDPITEHWLGYLVETMTARGAAAVGARLIYPRQRRGRRAGADFANLTLQHGGVEFDRSGAIPMPIVIGAGDDPKSAGAMSVEEKPALTAACLLVDRAAFDAVGGFTAGYDYGTEDIDLCLKLRAAGGRLTYDGRAALWHHESATRAADLARFRGRVARNRELYVDTWGPRIFRDALLDAIGGGTRFSSAPFHVAITVTSHDPGAGFGDWYTGHELGDALQALGWRVTYMARPADGWYKPDPSVEAVVVLLDACDIRRLPRHLVTMAWVRNWPDRWLDRPWFDDYDIVFASSGRIVEMVHDQSAHVATLLPLATNPGRFAPSRPNPDLACDVLFVGNYWGQPRGVIEALPALAAGGLAVHVHGRGWDKVPGMAALDRGFLAYEDVPSAYASARVVVDDAATSTKAFGSVNSRVFDALAAGTVVVSDGALGVHDRFDKAFPTWSDGPALISIVERILGDPDGTTDQVRGYRSRILAEHTYEHRAATLRATLEAWAAAPRYGLRIGVPSWDVVERWGDYYFARALQRSLERAGHPTRIHFLPDWELPVGAREDVTVHLLGLKEAPTRPGQVNLLWQISHPDLATPEMYDRYDHAFVASDGFAERMASSVRIPVTSLHQATDPEQFIPDPTGPRHELLFVANSRRVRRRIVDDLAGTNHDLAVYGRGWTRELIDERFVKGESIPNADLARYYAAATIVLNDHWDDMRDEGFMSNRLYDAVACGAFVISDDVEGIDREFEGAVVTYRTKAELEPLIARYLADPIERRRRAEHGRQIILERHTFDLRAKSLREIADPILALRPRGILNAVLDPPPDTPPTAHAVEPAAPSVVGSPYS